MEPAYSFTIPSVEDDTILDCRLYHPEGILQTVSAGEHGSHSIKGAVIAHPYAPLGGCYDDPIVLSLTSNLLQQGYIVATFNFRGAGGSQGRTSWSGRGEGDDYISVIGFMLYHLKSLARRSSGLASAGDSRADYCSVRLILAGYSYGSLILSKLPPIHAIVNRFDTAVIGTSAAEVMLRAQRLAAETKQSIHDLEAKQPRGRAESLAASMASTQNRSRAHSLTVTVGGEETDASERRLSSRDARHPIDLVKKSVQVPRRIKVHLRRRSSSKSGDKSPKHSQITTPEESSKDDIRLAYLLISPLLAPLAHTLVLPSNLTHIFGHHSEANDVSSGFGSLNHCSLAVWGGQDGFTSSKKLRMWVDKLQEASQLVQGVCIEPAGHFWRENGVMKDVLQHMNTWIKSSDVS